MNEKSNKTAVEWLFDNLNITGGSDDMKAFEKAKEMEKQQIIESWDNGFANGYDLGKHDDQPNPDDAEQYYNETYGK